jgi:hypothetical protein
VTCVRRMAAGVRRLLFMECSVGAAGTGALMRRAPNDPDAAHVAVRAAHEIAQLRMFIGGGQHSDPIRLTRHAKSAGRIIESRLKRQ